MAYFIFERIPNIAFAERVTQHLEKLIASIIVEACALDTGDDDKAFRLALFQHTIVMEALVDRAIQLSSQTILKKPFVERSSIVNPKSIKAKQYSGWFVHMLEAVESMRASALDAESRTEKLEEIRSAVLTMRKVSLNDATLIGCGKRGINVKI